MFEHVAKAIGMGAALLFMFPYMAAAKFAYKPPGEASEGDRRAVPRYMSAVVTHHNWFKFGGGIGIWVSFLVLDVVDPAAVWLGYSARGVFFVSIALYSSAMVWRMVAIANKGRRSSLGRS